MEINDLIPLKALPPGDQPANSRPIAPAPAGREQHLVPGLLFKARVERVFRDGTINLSFDGGSLAVKSRAPVETGRDVWLEVRQAGDLTWLSPADKKGAVQEFLKELFAGRVLLNDAVGTLSSWAAGASPAVHQENPASLSFLQNLAGIFLTGNADAEKIIRLLSWINTSTRNPLYGSTLTAQLADFLTFRRHDRRSLHMLDATAGLQMEKFSKLIDRFHQVNTQALTPDQNPFFIFPCIFANSAGWGEWIFNSAPNGGGRNGRVTLTFFLEMSRLGEVCLHLSLHEETLTGTLHLADDSIKNHIAQRLPELSGIFDKLGYRSTNLVCRVADADLFRDLSATLQEMARIRPAALFDIRA